MKTFEEQLTAWIDECLPADEHVAFERTLAARPDADALRAEKRASAQLRSLLRDHLHAPALSNPDFFNHGIMARIDAEPRQRASWWPRWDWTPARLLAAGVACLLTAMIGIRVLIPTGAPEPRTSPAAVALTPEPATKTPVAVVTTPEPASGTPRGPGSTNDGVVVRNNVPSPVIPVEPAPEQPTAGNSAVTATPLHFDEGDADVIWLDGSDYLPNLDASPAPAAPSPR